MNRVFSSIFLLLLFFVNGFGQSTTELPKNSVQVFFGSSFHGTDNVLGVAISTEYSHYFHRKLSYTVFIGATVHDGQVAVIFWNGSGEIIDGAVDFTTAGLQVGTTLGYSFYRTKRHHVQGSLGTLFRYQTTSNPDILGLYIPYPYVGYDLSTRSYSVGGIAAFSYDFTFKNNVFIGFKGSLQYDSNDDALSIFSLGIGKRF